MFKHILFATDGSLHSQKAIEYVKDFALKNKAKVTTIHAYELIGEAVLNKYGGQMADYMSELENFVKDKSVNLLKDTDKEFLDAGIETSHHIIRGNAKHEIVTYAEENQCDLIILGTRGMSTLKSLLVGSVSHYVTHHAHCPVLLVR